MRNGKLILVFIIIILLGYGAHRLIRKFINPKDSASHLFLFFLAHFLAIFLLAFGVNFIVIHYLKYLFG